MLKKILRLLLINFLALILVERWLKGGVIFFGNYQIIIITALVLTLVNQLVRPIINLLLLPLNLITLGTMRWLINVLTLYLVTLLVPQFKLQAFDFVGYNYQGFIIPAAHLSIIFVYILTSFLISLISTFFLWLIK